MGFTYVASGPLVRSSYHADDFAPEDYQTVMSFAKANKRHAALAEEIRRHDHAYYVLAEPTISDPDYDRLYRELLDLEAAHPELVTTDSPSQRVGGKPVSEFPEHRHAVPMMSLDNTYSFEELADFQARVEKLLRGGTGLDDRAQDRWTGGEFAL